MTEPGIQDALKRIQIQKTRPFLRTFQTHRKTLGE
jgi:hypothetical protein